MSRFDYINLEGMLNELEKNNKPWDIGDTIVGDIDETIGIEVFKKFEDGEHLHALTRFDACVTTVILKLLLKTNIQNVNTLDKLPGIIWIVDTGKTRYPKHVNLVFELNKLIIRLNKDKKGSEKPSYMVDLEKDIKTIHRLGNHYANSSKKVDIINKKNRDDILEGMMRIWNDLKQLYSEATKAD